ncbi:MAG: hypothetical protein R3D84_09925 [Paracoccaceae bacterium]
MNANALIFIATGKSGLGHLRRVTTVALALRRARPGLDLGLLTNAAPAGIGAEELRVFDRVVQRPRTAMAAAMAGHTGTIVCDTAQVPGIAHVPGCKILILRETVTEEVARFAIQGGWDRVIVPNPRRHWMPGGAALSPSVEAAGWIVRPTGARSLAIRPPALS